MTIEVPDTYAIQFELFEKLEAVLHEAYSSEKGVSRLKIGQVFGTGCTATSCWKEPAFVIWAALKGCAQSGDFFELWDDEDGVAAEDDAESVEVGG